MGALAIAVLAGVTLLGIGCGSGLSGSARAAIYWGNSNTLGRVNLDGGYYLDGYGPGLLYIGYNGDSAIAGVCGVAVDGTHIYWGTDTTTGLGEQDSMVPKQISHSSSVPANLWGRCQ